MRVNSLQEYQDFVQQHNIPLDKIRFALGEDKGHEPRWFYIYQDRFTGEWVVAKNKSDGSTAERYRGTDEAKACQILFDKMEEEFNKRQYAAALGGSYDGYNKKRRMRERMRRMIRIGIYDLFIGLIIVCAVYYIYERYFYKGTSDRRPGQGYYVFWHTYDDGSVWDDLYYYLDNSWYYYDDEYDDWYADNDFDYSYDYVDDYYVGDYYSSLDGYYDGEAWDFDDTTYYQFYLDSLDYDNNNSYNNNYYYDDDNYYYDNNDNDSWDSYDWDDWDSYDSDWDSDW